MKSRKTGHWDMRHNAEKASLSDDNMDNGSVMWNIEKTFIPRDGEAFDDIIRNIIKNLV